MLANDGDVVTSGTTDGGMDQLGGVACGTRGGGTGAPERVYEFIAPLAGTYDIAVQGEGFAPLLHVRRGGCMGPFVACAVDASSGSRPELSVALDAEERIAIAVDGNGAGRSGLFALSITPQRADLAVAALSVPSAANAGDSVPVQADVVNLGNGPSPPFAARFLLARDLQLAEPLGGTPVGCQLPALAPGASTRCAPAIPLDVPLVAAGSYAIGVRIDAGDAVAERDEANNVGAGPIRIDVLGSELTQDLFRADDGRAYQLIRVVPRRAPRDAEVFRILSLASTLSPSSQPVEVCSTLTGIASTATGSTAASLFGVRRTAVITPPSDDLSFDPTAGGHLRLGRGPSAIDICHQSDDCPVDGQQAALVDLATDDGKSIPAACVVRGLDPSCIGHPIDTIAFGLEPDPQDPQGSCLPDQLPTVQTPLCGPEPADGFRLVAGEAVVLVHNRSPRFDEGFSGGIAALGIDGDDRNAPACGAGQVVDAVALLRSLAERFPEARNDRCEGPSLTLPGCGFNPFECRFNSWPATMDASDPVPACGNGSRARSLWYRLELPLGRTGVTVSANVSYDAILSAYTGSCGALMPLAGGCDAGPRPTLGPLSLGPGTYYFMLSSMSGEGGLANVFAQ